MWNKIKDVNELKAGITINQYPVEGDPVNEIDMSDGRNLLTFQIAEVTAIDGPKILLI
jgi:hypothetical protein